MTLQARHAESGVVQAGRNGLESMSVTLGRSFGSWLCDFEGVRGVSVYCIRPTRLVTVIKGPLSSSPKGPPPASLRCHQFFELEVIRDEENICIEGS